MYGITETTVHVTWHEVRAAEATSRAPSVIGGPLAHLHLHVLDPHLQPMPDGVAGELYVGGAGLARGYLDRPELTAVRFLPNPWSGVPGDRLYKTGDVARRRRTGALEFIGRNDRQVKIRGFRVELREIERTLERCPSVARAVVLATPGPDGQPALRGFLQPQVDEDAPVIRDIRGWLKQRMPEYMVPATLQFVEAFPLTSNGKLDAAALLALEPHARANDVEAARPEHPIEIAIGEVWQELLGPRPMRLDDNFFEVGGHSLLATRVVTRIQERLGVELSLRDFFAHPTIRELATGAEAALLRHATSMADMAAAAGPNGGSTATSVTPTSQ
jgi:acyl carrier protein